MVTSLSELCCRATLVASFVIQGERRQTPDRRKSRRGGRRADDIEPGISSIDLRAIALRRAGQKTHLASSSADGSSDGGTHAPDVAHDRPVMMAGHRTVG